MGREPVSVHGQSAQSTPTSRSDEENNHRNLPAKSLGNTTVYNSLTLSDAASSLEFYFFTFFFSQQPQQQQHQK
jgi:hypothetical protein